jgi:hypothetical protein
MRTYIALMFEVTAVVCLIAAVVVVTDIFWAKSSLPSAQPTQLSQPHKTQKSPATAEAAAGDFIWRSAPSNGRYGLECVTRPRLAYAARGEYHPNAPRS